jgi:hypothetical protein
MKKFFAGFFPHWKTRPELSVSPPMLPQQHWNDLLAQYDYLTEKITHSHNNGEQPTRRRQPPTAFEHWEDERARIELELCQIENDDVEPSGRANPRSLMTITHAQTGKNGITIEELRGHNSNVDMTIRFRNRNPFPVSILSMPGFVIVPSDSAFQRMITVRFQAWNVAGSEPSPEWTLQALCGDAHKHPPCSHDGPHYTIDCLTPALPVRRVLKAVHAIERNIVTHLRTSEKETTSRNSSHRESLRELARHAHIQETSSGNFKVLLAPAIIQYALWQVTDHVSFDELVHILQIERVKEVDMLKQHIRFANILLRKAEIMPTIKL